MYDTPVSIRINTSHLLQFLYFIAKTPNTNAALVTEANFEFSGSIPQLMIYSKRNSAEPSNIFSVIFYVILVVPKLKIRGIKR